MNNKETKTFDAIINYWLWSSRNAFGFQIGLQGPKSSLY